MFSSSLLLLFCLGSIAQKVTVEDNSIPVRLVVDLPEDAIFRIGYSLEVVTGDIHLLGLFEPPHESLTISFCTYLLPSSQPLYVHLLYPNGTISASTDRFNAPRIQMLDETRLSCGNHSLPKWVDSLVSKATLDAFEPSMTALQLLSSASAAYKAATLPDDLTAVAITVAAQTALLKACPGQNDVQRDPPSALIVQAAKLVVPIASTLAMYRVGISANSAAASVCAIGSLAQAASVCALRTAARVAAVDASTETFSALIDLAALTAASILGPSGAPLSVPLPPNNRFPPPSASVLLFGSPSADSEPTSPSPGAPVPVDTVRYRDAATHGDLFENHMDASASVGSLRQDASVPRDEEAVVEAAVAARQTGRWDRVRSVVTPILSAAGAFAQGARDAAAADTSIPGVRTTSVRVPYTSVDTTGRVARSECAGSVWVVGAPSTSSGMGAIAWLRAEAAGAALGAHAVTLPILEGGCKHVDLSHDVLYGKLPSRTASSSTSPAPSNNDRVPPKAPPQSLARHAWIVADDSMRAGSESGTSVSSFGHSYEHGGDVGSRASTRRRNATSLIWESRQRGGGTDECMSTPSRALDGEDEPVITSLSSAVWGESSIVCDGLPRGLYIPTGARALMWTEKDASATAVQTALMAVLAGEIPAGIVKLSPTDLATQLLGEALDVAPCGAPPSSDYIALGGVCHPPDVAATNFRPGVSWRNISQCRVSAFPSQRLLTARVLSTEALTRINQQHQSSAARGREGSVAQMAGVVGVGSTLGPTLPAGVYDGTSLAWIEPLSPDIYFNREHVALIVPLMTVYLFYVLGLILSCIFDQKEDKAELAKYSEVMFREAGGVPLDKQGVPVTELRPYERFHTKAMTAERVRAVTSFMSGMALYLSWSLKHRHKYVNFYYGIPLATYSRSRRLAVLMTSIVTCFATSSLIVHFGIVEAIDIGKTSSFSAHSVRVWVTAGFVGALCAAPAYWLPEIVFRRAQRQSSKVYFDMAQYYTRVRAFVSVTPLLRQSLQFDEYFDHVDRLKHAQGKSAGDADRSAEPRGEALVDLGVTSTSKGGAGGKGGDGEGKVVTRPRRRSLGERAGAALHAAIRKGGSASPGTASFGAGSASVPNNITFDPSFTSAQMAAAHTSSTGARRLGYADPWRWLPRKLAYGNLSAYSGTPLATSNATFSVESAWKTMPSGETSIRLPLYGAIVLTTAMTAGILAYISAGRHQLAFVFTVVMTVFAAGILFRLRCWSARNGSTPYGTSDKAVDADGTEGIEDARASSAPGSRAAESATNSAVQFLQSSGGSTRSKIAEWIDDTVLQYVLFNGTDGAIAWLGGVCLTSLVGQIMAYDYDLPASLTAFGVVLAFLVFLFSYYVVFLGTASAFFASQLCVVLDSLVVVVLALLHSVGGIPTFDHLSRDVNLLFFWFTAPVCGVIYVDWVFWNRKLVEEEMRPAFGPIAWGVVWIFQLAAAFIAFNDTIRVPPESVASIGMGILVALLVDGLVIDTVRMLALSTIYTIFSLRMRPRIALEDLLHEFQRYDLDKNGMLDIEEFTDLMLDLGLADDLSEVANLFVRAGGDKTDGQLSFEQFQKAIAEKRGRAGMDGNENARALQSHIGSRRRELYSLFIQLAEDGQKLPFEDLFEGLCRRFESFNRCREELEGIAWQVANYDTPPMHSYAGGYRGRSPVLPPDMTFDNFVAFVHRIQKLSSKTRDTATRRSAISFAAMVFEAGSSIFKGDGEGGRSDADRRSYKQSRMGDADLDDLDDDDDDEWDDEGTVNAPVAMKRLGGR